MFLSLTLKPQVQGLSSASDAGLQKGDIVFSVNGQPVQGQTLQSISDQVQRDASTTLTIGVSRPNSSLDRSRPLSPMSANSSPIPAGAVTQSQVNDLFRPLPRSPIPSSGVKRYDPASAQDQEKMMYEEERNHEVRAIKTTPYRSQAVVSPKPKVLHDHVQGSYLQMQHYPDAPTHGHMMNHVSPMPARRVMQEAQFQHYVQQVDPTAASIGPVAMQYNSPIGLYSQENAINTLRQTHGGHQASGNSSGHQVSHGPSSRLMPDNVVMEGSERKLNLAASPTFRMVQAMEQGAGKVHEPVQDRVYSPIPTYIPNETGNDPQQSASFKVRTLFDEKCSNSFSSFLAVPDELPPLSPQSLRVEKRTMKSTSKQIITDLLSGRNAGRIETKHHP